MSVNHVIHTSMICLVREQGLSL